ncbi:MAG: threonine synthase [Clostridia bacterium]|nr:threonine synthase [Clostridia bacterium]
MDFYSTRGSGPVSGARAIIDGLAKDGGLYVPSSFPKITPEELRDLSYKQYYERAAFVITKFLDEFTEDEMADYAELAYFKFDNLDPAPLVKVDDNMYILELWHGPTCAFKDVALTLLPHLLSGSKKKENVDKKTLILVATSGDTGKAALEGFKDVENTEIVCLYPSEGVSEMQKLQMVTTGGKNTHVIGINGNFDDAQRAVKEIFSSKEINELFNKHGYELSSANSINFGRLVPQIVYYISAYVDLYTNNEINYNDPVNFVVPSGNFGNILAAYYAKQMGINIKNLIVASNKNNVLTEFFETGRYDANRKFYKTISPSMDILVSSNLERLIYEVEDRNPEAVKKLMESLKEFGTYSIDMKTLEKKLPEFYAYSTTEEETKEVIENVFDEYGYLLDPHTAVAVSAYMNYMNEFFDDIPTVIVSTASPYKFPVDVLKAVEPEAKVEEDPFKAIKKLDNISAMDAPKSIKELKELPINHTTVVDKENIKEAVIKAVLGDK